MYVNTPAETLLINLAQKVKNTLSPAFQNVATEQRKAILLTVANFFALFFSTAPLCIHRRIRDRCFYRQPIFAQFSHQKVVHSPHRSTVWHFWMIMIFSCNCLERKSACTWRCTVLITGPSPFNPRRCEYPLFVHFEAWSVRQVYRQLQTGRIFWTYILCLPWVCSWRPL